jgi:hypothetical protein
MPIIMACGKLLGNHSGEATVGFLHARFFHKIQALLLGREAGYAFHRLRGRVTANYHTLWVFAIDIGSQAKLAGVIQTTRSSFQLIEIVIGEYAFLFAKCAFSFLSAALKTQRAGLIRR